MRTLRKIFAFIKRDFLIQISYRFAFIFEWLSILATVATFYFIAKLFGEGILPYLKEYQMAYFPFVLVGITFSGYFATAMHSFAGRLRQEQVMGTLEAMLVTPTRLSVIIIALSIWDFIFTSITVAVYLCFGVLFFRLDLSQMNFLSTAVILFLTIISFSSIGIISASFTMILKKGDPVSWLITTLSGFLGGVFFPVTVLPKTLRLISYCLPITYSLKGLRQAILQGYSLRVLIVDTVILLAFCIILLPLSIFTFKYAVKKSKCDGSIAHY